MFTPDPDVNGSKKDPVIPELLSTAMSYEVENSVLALKSAVLSNVYDVEVAGVPPATKAVAQAPLAPAKHLLSGSEVCACQVVPLYSSVADASQSPPIAIASFCTPAPDKPPLPLFSTDEEDQTEPSYSSVRSEAEGVEPPNANPVF